jgi:hypothetical protein
MEGKNKTKKKKNKKKKRQEAERAKSFKKKPRGKTEKPKKRGGGSHTNRIGVLILTSFPFTCQALQSCLSWVNLSPKITKTKILAFTNHLLWLQSTHFKVAVRSSNMVRKNSQREEKKCVDVTFFVRTGHVSSRPTHDRHLKVVLRGHEPFVSRTHKRSKNGTKIAHPGRFFPLLAIVALYTGCAIFVPLLNAKLSDKSVSMEWTFHRNLR